MKFFSTLFTLLILIFAIENYAQVPNGDFESWAGGEPTGWYTNNIGYTLITQSSDVHGGSSAVRGDNVMAQTIVLQPLLISGLIGGHGFPISERYANLTGYYKLNAVGADNLSIVVAPFKNGQVIGVGAFQYFAASTYTLFTIPIYYSNNQTPDSCQISITIGNNSGPVNLGSYFLLDDLAFSGIAADVDDEGNAPYKFALEQNYPNPFNPSTTVRYSLPAESFVSIKVYNITGKEITTLINESQTAGEYQITFSSKGGSASGGEAYSLASGVYLLRMSAGEFNSTIKMNLLK
jgi:hypothetical protein